MALGPGTRLGAYEIISLLGSGGMGEVYRARDAKLGRDVAIKVLPQALADDPERLARFDREAKTLAALSHPNIAHIYGFEDSTGVPALVMELVEGLTLADRIARGPIPVDEALPIAKQIADGLEAAHEQGIIHRDLKPANIKLRDDGTVKILDFGLAKALEPKQPSGVNVTQSPTITTPVMMTGVGVILGTAAYMSPEQVKGKPADRRSDMWAFGCVLFEMLTAHRTFPGDEIAEILAGIVKADVDWMRLPPTVPANIRVLLRRCLRKDPRQRLADAGAARIEIEETGGAPAEPMRTAAGMRPALGVGIAIATIAAIGLGYVLGVRVRNGSARRESSAVVRLTATLPPATELTAGASVAISPDGNAIAYVAERGNVPRLYVRSIADAAPRVFAGTENAAGPFFSPDGQWLAFYAGGKLKKLSMSSGVVQTLADARSPAYGGSWNPSGGIVFQGKGTELLETSENGGAVQTLVAQGSNPEFLPGGGAVLFTVTPGGAPTSEETEIHVLQLKTGKQKVIGQGTAPHYLRSGHLVFQRPGSLMAARFDLDRLELVSAPVVVIEGIRQPYSGVGAFSCSNSGTCVYVAGTTLREHTVALVDRTGASQTLSLSPNSYAHPRFSPKGDKLVFWIQQLRCWIEVYDLTRGTTTRITSEGDNHYPVWTADGQRVIYTSRKPASAGYAIFSKAVVGGAEQRLSGDGEFVGSGTPLAVAPGANAIAFADGGHISILSLSGSPKRQPFTDSIFTETMPAFSPDGHWMAFVSSESGRYDVYVQPYPSAGEKYLISVEGGSEPVWARNGSELFYRIGDQLMSVQLTTQPTFSASRPRPLFSRRFAQTIAGADYDVSPDGERFVMLNPGEQERAATEITVLLNWFAELQQRIPSK